MSPSELGAGGSHLLQPATADAAPCMPPSHPTPEPAHSLPNTLPRGQPLPTATFRLLRAHDGHKTLLATQMALPRCLGAQDQLMMHTQ